jgi:hypothetical protein
MKGAFCIKGNVMEDVIRVLKLLVLILNLVVLILEILK